MRKNRRLNPCSNGSTILGAVVNRIGMDSIGLNPCSNGSTILGRGEKSKLRPMQLVLILVLMEVLFWERRKKRHAGQKQRRS